MQNFSQFISEHRLDEATARSPFTDSQIHKAFANAGLSGMQRETEGFVYGGYSPRARTHVYAIIWDDPSETGTNDKGEKLSYAINIVWVYLGASGKIEADVSPVPKAEQLHIDTAMVLAGQIAKKEYRSRGLNG